MANDELQQHQEQLLRIHRSNAHKLEQQIARSGMYPPLHLLNALEHEQQQIAAITAQLEPDELWIEQHAAPAPLRVTRRMPLAPQKPHTLNRLPKPLSFYRFNTIGSVVWQTRRNTVRWWTAGAISFLLVVGTLIFLLVHPTPNAAFVEHIRGTPASNHASITITAGEATPTRLSGIVGMVMTLTLFNQTDQPCRWVLVDGDQSAAATMLATVCPPTPTNYGVSAR